MQEGKEQTRQHARVPATRRVALELKDRGKYVQCYTSNLSRGGIFLRTLHPPAQGTRVMVVVQTPGGEDVAIEGEVVSVLGVEEAKTRSLAPGVGVKFDAIPPEVQGKLDAIYQDCVREAGAVQAAGSANQWVPAEPVTPPRGVSLRALAAATSGAAPSPWGRTPPVMAPPGPPVVASAPAPVVAPSAPPVVAAALAPKTPAAAAPPPLVMSPEDFALPAGPTLAPADAPSAPAAAARCPSCGEPADPGRRSCVACGAALTPGEDIRPPPPESHLPEEVREHIDAPRRAEDSPPQRRHAAVLCAEVSGLTALADKGADVAAAMDRCFNGLIDAVHRHGGAVDKFVGDGLVAVFFVSAVGEAAKAGGTGDPAPPAANGDDDALRAVRAALDMQTFFSGPGTQPPEPLGLRIGVAAGQVLSGHMGPPGRRVYTVLGEPVKAAQALEQTAPAGGILASAEVLRDCGAGIEFKPFAAEKGKSKRDAPPAHVVVGLAKVDPAARELPLVGRDMQLTQIEYLSEALAAGEPCAVVVTGVPGVGKTRLTAEAVRKARARDWLAFIAYPPKFQPPPLAAFRPVLLAAAGLDESAELSQLTIAEKAFLKLGLGKEDVEALLALMWPERGGEKKRGVAGSAIAQLLERLARTRPVLLAVDDVQWASHGAMDLLELLTGKDGPPGLLVMVVGRPEAAGALPNAHGRLEIALEPLAESEVAQLAAHALDAPEVPPELAAWVAERAQGNPRSARDAVLALLASGAVAVEAGRVRFQLPIGHDPTALDAPALLRVKRAALRKEIQQALALAAAASERPGAAAGAPATFEAAVVQKALDDPETPYYLEESRLRGLVAPVEGAAGAFAFASGAARAVALAGVTPEELPQLHEKLWRALEGAGAAAGLGPAELHTRMAHHAEQAGQPDEAGGLLQKGAETHLDAGQPGEAVRLLARALALLPADARPKQRLALTLRQAECAIRAGDLATAEQQLGPALSLARDIGDRPAEAAATRVQARLLRLQGKLEAAQAASEQAITAGIKSGDQAAWMLARIELADVYDARGDNAKALSEYKAALVQADEAVRQAAKAAGERSVRARLCNRIATLQAKTGDAATAEETLLRALDEARKDKDPQEEGRALASLGALCARRGDRARARLYADQAIDCARAAGDRLTEARQLYNLGQLAYADRDLAGAKVSFEEARGLAEKIGWQEGLTMVARALDRVGTKAAP